MEETVLYSDDAILVANKPAGLRTIVDGYDPTLPYLSRLLQEQLGRVWVVHRLDKDTSGVILFARTAEAHRALNIQFDLRETRKEYHAIVIGTPEWNETTIDLPLRINADRRHRTLIDHQHGKPAKTEARVIKHAGGFARLMAVPLTGYTHQIRAHLAVLDFPVLADPLYKSMKPETEAIKIARQTAAGLPIQRLALHAYQITFKHPASGALVTFQAPYPADFQAAVEALSL